MIAMLPHPVLATVAAGGEEVRVLGLWEDPHGGSDQWLVLEADGTPRYEFFSAIRLSPIQALV